MTKVLVLYYSAGGHTEALAKAVAEGATATGAEVKLKRVPDLDEGTAPRRKSPDIEVATPEELVDYDAIIIGSPTRYGRLCAQVANFLDQTVQMWKEGKLIGKVGGAFTCTASQHGGSESTIFSILTSMMHHGIITVGLPYSFKGLLEMGEPAGGSPYGATTITGSDGSRWPSEVELAGARYQGSHIAEVTHALSAGRAIISNQP
ncbi:NAD(P)H:quinone oxidoreductase [Salinicola salarius]|uniref:NAD(P)H:quinone oxidoreductase n=1 Tax=Salinicola salarius TaxID=430457 RepID=UPI000B4035F4|nr:NAD(P)H:quinone oxidoreductase [Salinicola salarius]